MANEDLWERLLRESNVSVADWQKNIAEKIRQNMDAAYPQEWATPLTLKPITIKEYILGPDGKPTEQMVKSSNGLYMPWKPLSQRNTIQHTTWSNHGTYVRNVVYHTTEPDPEAIAEDPESTFPRSRSDMPILAHRGAIPVLHRGFAPGKFWYSVNRGMIGGAEETAKCEHNTKRPRYWSRWSEGYQHDPDNAPHALCTCGFYALPPDMKPSYNGIQYVTLIVELAGKVLRCRKGYKAEWQGVVEVQLPRCSWCAEPMTGWMVDRASKQPGQVYCDEHKPRGKRPKNGNGKPDRSQVLIRRELYREIVPAHIPITDEPKPNMKFDPSPF